MKYKLSLSFKDHIQACLCEKNLSVAIAKLAKNTR